MWLIQTYINTSQKIFACVGTWHMNILFSSGGILLSRNHLYRGSHHPHHGHMPFFIYNDLFLTTQFCMHIIRSTSIFVCYILLYYMPILLYWLRTCSCFSYCYSNSTKNTHFMTSNLACRSLIIINSILYKLT